MCTIPMLPGGIGTGPPGPHALTIERLTENVPPCDWCVQPVPGSQASVVQAFPSSQLGGGPPLHCPPLQTSPVVQALPSLHDALLFTWTQPAEAVHESSVHGLWSSQEMG